MSESKVVGIVCLATLSISFSTPISRMLMQWDVPSTVLAFYRMLFSVCMLAPFALGKPSCRQEVKRLTPKDVLLLFLAGIFLALHLYCLYLGVRYTTIFAATVLIDMSPIFVLVGAYFLFGEKPRKLSLLGVLITFLGILVIGLGDTSAGGTNNLLGDGFAFLGAILGAAYFLCNKYLRTRLSLTVHTFYLYGVSTLVFFAVILLEGSPLFQYSLEAYLLFLLSALLCSILGHSIFNWALKYVNAVTVSLIMLGEPLFASIWSYLLFGETMGLFVFIGGLAILCGLTFYTLSEAKKPPAFPQEKKRSFFPSSRT